MLSMWSRKSRNTRLCSWELEAINRRFALAGVITLAADFVRISELKKKVMADGLAPMRLCPSVPDMAQLVWHQKTTMTPRESFIFPKKTTVLRGIHSRNLEAMKPCVDAQHSKSHGAVISTRDNQDGCLLLFINPTNSTYDTFSRDSIRILTRW